MFLYRDKSLWVRGSLCVMFVHAHRFLPQQMCRKDRAIHDPVGFWVLSSVSKQEKKRKGKKKNKTRLEATPYVSIIQEVILGDNKRG